ncbi:VWA domain-containing protein [Thiomicrorhabdus sp. Milos-T2]|uniref:VWA domain-containing protein n=1 Tax=Thiomicrorhabdus sp. Milos-T2 TaxID=90814 RepID=UPI000493D1FF|nr:VWA domain-containing protein [Thiomicrorhabdus sp. Milos-T2]
MAMTNLIETITNLSFVWPWMIAFLPLPWIIRRVIKPLHKEHSPLLAPQIIARIEDQLPTENLIEAEQPTKRIPLIAILLWISLIIAATRPVLYLDSTPFKVSGKELILAVDLSGSMQKADMYLNGDEVNRLVAVKSVVSDFINHRQGDRMGLIVFGTQAFLQSPLTYDLKTVNTLLTEAEIGMAGNNTAIGDAIGLTLKHLHETHSTKNAVLILLTDGSNTAGTVNPLDAASKAQQMGLKIYTVGVGRVKSRTGLDLFMTNKSDMDIDTLTKISDLTGGQFFLANDTNQLAEIYQKINELESVEHEIFNYRLRTEFYPWPLALALLFSGLLAWSQLRKVGA